MKLLVLVHADASVIPLYRAALGPGVDVLAFVGPPIPGIEGGGMSSRYDALASACLIRSRGSLLDGLFKKYVPPRPLADYSAIWMATWSAGYALPRRFLAADRTRIAGLILLDSGHAELESDGTALDSGVAWAVTLARVAKAGGPRLHIGHSDVKTYGSVASTTQFAREVVRLSGGTGEGFDVEAFDIAEKDLAEHVAALRGWGPAFVADAIGVGPLLDDVDDVTPQFSPPWRDAMLSLGARALAYGLDYLGIREVAGAAWHPQISAWLRRCERNGRLLGLQSDEVAWCAAFASACTFDACLPGEVPLHAFRASVAELWADAVRAGAARPATFTPNIGDLVISKRDGQDPRMGGKGHVGRFMRSGVTLDGNHNNSVAIVTNADPRDIVGYITYPQPERGALLPERAAQFLRLSEAAMRGGGLPDIETIVGKQ